MLDTNVVQLYDFTLEILRGCKNKCYGCHVAREEQDGFADGDVARLKRLFDDSVNKGFKLVNLAIGPTDFMSATNTVEMLETSQPLMDMFETIFLQSTFMYPDEELKKWGKILNKKLKGRSLKLGFPLDPRHWDKDKYLTTIISKIDVMLAEMPDVTYKKTYVLVNLKNYANIADNPLSTMLLKAVDSRGVPMNLALLIGAGRLDLSDINNRLQLKAALTQLKDLHEIADSSVTAALNLSQCYTERSDISGVNDISPDQDHDVTYRGGELFSTCFMGENITVFEPEFKFPKINGEWTADSLLQGYNDHMVAQLTNMPDGCSACEYVEGCIQKRILLMMSVLKTKNCIAPKSTFDKYHHQ